MAEWREWQYGGKNGRMAEWQKWLHTYYLRYTYTDDDTDDDDDDDDDDDTLIFYSIDEPISSRLPGGYKKLPEWPINYPRGRE